MSEEKQPLLMILAGPNGAGKTTAAMTLLKEYIHIPQFVNADEIARGLSPLDPPSVRVQAGKLMLQRISQLISERDDFAVETTASGNVHARTMQRCRDAGYYCKLAFVFLQHPELSVNRVKLRVLKGGHHVPKEDIVRRYHLGLKRFFNQYKPLAHEWILYDNTYNDMRKIAHQRPDGFDIHEPHIWEFLEEKYGEA